MPNNSIVSYNPIGDPYFSNVVLLLHMEANNGAFNFADAKAHTVSSTAPASTTRKKFGNTSAYHTTHSTCVTVANHADFDFAFLDFTMEGWVNYSAAMGSAGALIGRWGIGSDVPDFLIQLTNDRKAIWNGAAISLSSTLTIPNDDQFHHVCCERWNGNLYIYIDGQSAGSKAIVNRVTSGARDLRTAIYDDGNSGMTGYIDEIRLTKGVARYKGPFTVPTEAFLNY